MLNKPEAGGWKNVILAILITLTTSLPPVMFYFSTYYVHRDELARTNSNLQASFQNYADSLNAALNTISGRITAAENRQGQLENTITRNSTAVEAIPSVIMTLNDLKTTVALLNKDLQNFNAIFNEFKLSFQPIKK